MTSGVGGAKLVHGLATAGDASQLWVFVNTGDDFEHLGLRICPDLDTTVYTLAGLADSERGWGRAGESWEFLSALEALGGPGWFRLGDRDLALNVLRTHELANGVALSDFSSSICRRLGIDAQVLPVTDSPVRTEILTRDGWLPFQDYFVRRRCEPEVREIRYNGSDCAHPLPELLEKLQSTETAAVILAPSNPWLSIGPILAVPGIASALRSCPAPVIAVTPIIQGDSVKGPTAKIMRELALDVSAGTIAGYYGDLIDGFILDVRDAHLEEAIDVPVCIADTLMITMEDRKRLALESVAFAGRLGKQAAAGTSE